MTLRARAVFLASLAVGTFACAVGALTVDSSSAFNVGLLVLNASAMGWQMRAIWRGEGEA